MTKPFHHLVFAMKEPVAIPALIIGLFLSLVTWMFWIAVVVMVWQFWARLL